jgi:hypothetical protein
VDLWPSSHLPTTMPGPPTSVHRRGKTTTTDGARPADGNMLLEAEAETSPAQIERRDQTT